MQDRFKLRFWDKQITKMRYGDIAISCEGEPFVIECDDNPSIKFLNDIEIMQCTGLKDKHGKLIYDLDYLQIDNTKYLIKMNIFNITLTNILTGDIIYLKDEYITSKSEIEGNYYECDTKISKNAKGGIN